MAHCVITHWKTTDWTDEMEALARDKYVPMVMALGADTVRMVRTGDHSFVVVTEYSDSAKAEAAQAKAAAIREEAAEELPMSMESMEDGAVFAGA